MNLQATVLFRYRKQFPNDTLKDISVKTNIQLTRVFRIFNGQDMKLKEYEAFETLIIEANPNASISNFLELSKKSIETLSNSKLTYLIGQMNQAIQIASLKHQKVFNLNKRQLA